jgi:membrane protease YdiL (CAAX protease family)
LPSPPNPLFDPPQPENSSQPRAEYLPPEAHPVPPARPRVEDPVWTGWEVLALACVTVLAIFFFLLVGALVAHRFLYPSLTLGEVAKFPGMVVVSQLLAYLLVFTLMYAIVKRDHGQDFGAAIRWNWPEKWTGYVLGGVVLSIGLQMFAHLLPIPKHLPMDQFFSTTREAYLLSIFGVTFAPLLEELFFRGFLYPVLARRLGMLAGILLTAAAFAIIHGTQLMFSWGPLLVIFIVGLVLTTVRAVTKSVAASLLLHMAYNGTISVIMFAVTGGFRHLERLNQ